MAKTYVILAKNWLLQRIHPTPLFLVLIVLCLTYLITVFNQEQQASQGSLNLQKLRIGYAIEPPYAYLDDKNNVTGESPESARKIASLLGVKEIQWFRYSFAELIPALENRQIDVIASGLFISRERQRRIRFTVPTLKVFPGLLVLSKKQHEFSNQLHENIVQDKRFVVIHGSIEEAKLMKLSQPVNSLTVSDFPAAINSLQKGGSDALLLSLPTLKRFIDHNDGFSVIELDQQAKHRILADYVAFAFHRQDTGLFNAWNSTMQTWVGSESHIQTIAPFGFSRQDMFAIDSR